jgi:hypothetical protein
MAMQRAGWIALCSAAVLQAGPQAGSHTEWTSRVAAHAEQFARKAAGVQTTETLVQRSYNLPPHARFAIGAAAAPVYARYLVNELVSDYTIAPLKAGAGNLVEFREILSLNGKTVRTPDVARKALARAVNAGEVASRKRMLEGLVKLGLVDVATDFGLLLLAFTNQAQSGVEWAEAGTAFVGAEEAAVLEWRQKSEGALEFMDGKSASRPMHGWMWVRRSDGVPLRVRAMFEHQARGRTIRDDTTIDFVLSRVLSCVTPATVAHRHFVDGFLLTENLYTYQPFRLFTTDSRIEFGRPVEPPKK